MVWAEKDNHGDIIYAGLVVYNNYFSFYWFVMNIVLLMWMAWQKVVKEM